MTNARKICLLLSFFLYILNASAQEEIKKDTTAQNSKGVLVNLTDGIATTVRHTGRKGRISSYRIRIPTEVCSLSD